MTAATFDFKRGLATALSGRHSVDRFDERTRPVNIEISRIVSKVCRGLGTRMRRLRRHEVSGVGVGAGALS
jgi:hypothetical protein